MIKSMDRPTAHPPLREAHRDYTRRRILDAATEALQEGQSHEISAPDVAARASISERTLYRYFPTRAELIQAVWSHVTAMFTATPFPDTPEDLIANPLQAFPEYDAQEPLIRAIVSTTQGKELRLSVNDARHTAIRKAIRQARPDLDEAALTRLCAVAQLLHSSVAWSAFRDYWGLSGPEAGLAASEALERLLRDAPHQSSSHPK